jgi:hypothetical protein
MKANETSGPYDLLSLVFEIYSSVWRDALYSLILDLIDVSFGILGIITLSLVRRHNLRACQGL